MRYDIGIDEVVLHGFGAVDSRRISAGLSEELGRLFVRDGLPSGESGLERVDGGHVEIVPGDDRATGHNIARGVYRGLRV